jgi:hypothetical protein
MTTRPTSFRLSDTTLARLKALAQPHEPAAQVIARALLALEAQDAAQDSSAAPPPGSALAQRLAALEARLAALEAGSAAVAHDALQPPEGRATDRTDNGRHASQDAATGRATGSSHSRPDYPPEVRRLAVQLADAGTAPVAIRQRIAEACGRSPDSKNWTKVLATWRKWAAQDSAT